MPRATRLRLEPGERRVLVVRRHPWLVLRPALPLVPLFGALILFSLTEYLLPGADLARFSALFVTVDLALAGLLFAKWLVIDLLSWWLDSYVITNRRLIAQRGAISIERREASLRAVEDSNYRISGPEARLFVFGDLTLSTAGRGNGIVFRGVPHPRRLQTLISAQAKAAREEHQQLYPPENAIVGALNRIFDPQGAVHDAPTQAIPPITDAAIRLQRRLRLLPEEVVLLVAHQHPLTLAAALLPPVILAIGGMASYRAFALPLPPLAIASLLAVLALWVLWLVLEWQASWYVLTTDRIVQAQRRTIFFELRSVTQLRAVKDVILRIHSASGRLFDLGTLTIETGADPLTLPAVPHPERFQRMIFEALDHAVQRDKLAEQERLAGTLTEWFKEYHRLQEAP